MFFNKKRVKIANQSFYSNHAIQCIMQDEYRCALHYFENCINDDGKGKKRIITINEFVLYNCVFGIIVESVSDDDVEVAETLVITNDSYVSFFKGCTNYNIGATHRTELADRYSATDSFSGSAIDVGGVCVGVPPP